MSPVLDLPSHLISKKGIDFPLFSFAIMMRHFHERDGVRLHGAKGSHSFFAFKAHVF